MIASLEYCIQSRDTPLQPVSNHNHKKDLPPPHISSDIKYTCHIIGDSHVRGLRDYLYNLLPSSCSIHTFFQPGAGYHEVAATHNQCPSLVSPSADDRIVLICGTNDVCSTQWALIQTALDDLIRMFQHCKQLCIIGVPMRFSNKKLNFHISRFNNKIRTYIKSTSKNAYFLDPNKSLKRKDYAIDGLHLNKEGKKKLCRAISNSIQGKPNSDTCQLPSKQGSNPENVNNATFCQDLIDLDVHYTSVTNETTQIHPNNMQPADDESTFSTEPRHYDQLFPELSPHRPTHPPALGSNSLLDTPNMPNHIHQLIRNEPKSSADYYRLTHIGNSTVQGNGSYQEHHNVGNNESSILFASPIIRIEPGYNRPASANFIEPGRHIDP
ncbi:hypothetical protein M8J76_009589 [Diaphorina citri]|nr:hypothetical protein M8J76_009589 [Diaphorina citri]